MQRVKTRSVTLNRNLTRTAVLLALALSFQIGLMPLAQPAVGPLVNMILVIAVITVGPLRALLIGWITPMMAFFLGIMPLAVLLPVVMLGNTALILVYSLMDRRIGRSIPLLPLATGATAKYVVMASLVRFAARFITPNIPPQLIQAFTLPQLYTALVGGGLALLIVRMLPKELKE